MKHVYSANAIKERLSCIEYLRERGIELKNGRCVASWRGGTHLSVHVEDKQWYDFVEKHGGSVIDLCAVVEFGGLHNGMRAIETLGERLKLKPMLTLKKAAKPTRSEMLAASGYKQVAAYDYRNENNTLVYQVIRFEKPAELCKPGENRKEFVHRTDEKECLGKDTPKLLYRLPSVIKSQEVFVVEGEKDADTLMSLGLCATTNSGGAKNFNPSLVKWLKGKDVIILPDNDEAGRNHGKLLVNLINPVANTLKCITLSQLPKGDVTDWINNEGGSLNKLREIVNTANLAVPDCSPEIAAAKDANKTPFTNYVEEFKEKESDDGKKKKVVRITLPIPINDLIRNVKLRFLDFPRMLGSMLFDYTRGADRRIIKLYNKDALFCWIQGVSGRPVMWASGEGMVTKSELFERLMQSVVRYDAISKAPFYPSRSDVFFTHEKLPPPDPTHSTFWELVNRFSMATPADRTLLAAFLLAPMFFYGGKGGQKPMFVVDTVDAQGSGKSTVVKVLAYLYNEEPISIDFDELKTDASDIRKRIISSTGRSKRIGFMDNLTSSIKGRALAELITTDYISARASYGRDEETRRNDLTFAATVNGASVETDFAVRCYIMRVKMPENKEDSWEQNTYKLIDENRLQLYADMIDLMANAPVRKRHGSRFEMFDKIVLSAASRTDEEYADVSKLIDSMSAETNEDSDVMEEFAELIEQTIRDNEKINVVAPLFFLSRDVDSLLQSSGGNLKKMTSRRIGSLIRQCGSVRFDKKFNRVRPNKQKIPCLTGVLYYPDGTGPELSVRNGRILYQVVRWSDKDGEFVRYGDPISYRVGDGGDNEQTLSLDNAKKEDHTLDLPDDPPF